MKPIRLETTSVDGTKINLEALYQIAPSCFTEEKDEETGEIKRVVNFETLRQLLGGDAVDEDEEMYQFTWPGKQAARREAAVPITDTLRPVPADSVDWDTTENLYIEGDNLRVLKLLQRGYMGKVKMIYIDPPYNTGNDFVYHDYFAHSAEEEDLAAGNIDEEGNRYRRNLDSNGRFHSDWCSMIYSRLLVAHSLLKEDGVIFISIDDNEVHNLRKICDEIFGAENFINQFCWRRRRTQANLSVNVSTVHEYVLCYTKQIEKIRLNRLPYTSEYIAHTFSNPDNDPKGPYQTGPLARPSNSSNREYTLTMPNGREITAKWSCSPETFQSYVKEGRLIIPRGGEGMPRIKIYLSELPGMIPNTWLDSSGTTDDANRTIQKLFDGVALFDYSKPKEFVEHLLRLGTSPDSLILDFFSGSATTAHAVMQLNAEDGGKRKYICVQLPEETPEGSEARKAGYETICEIGKERIRRAGKKIKEESQLTTQDLDTGFRVFRIDSGNYKNVTKQPNEYDQQMLDFFVDNIKADRTDLDLLFGAMLAWGVQLSLPMTTEEVDGCKIYAVDGNGLVACFAENVSENVVQAMAAKQPLRVLFRDSCFDEDKTKINIFERFKQQLDWDEKEAIQNIRVV
ncbi:site-specific DNA-methyltransferase [Prevotella pallens]|uniref:site-specific DNA-methyltransferase n=1 Tax=Prevotella pallens TaxID=60133 RepID=UPI0028D2E42A|nr:site-specific DNA-methyltransferase [Prevotella pallens]